MSYRCINAFAFDGVVYPNGFQAEDGDPILKSHGEHFAEVDESGPLTARAVEQAVAEPGGLRAAPKKKAPAKKAPAKAASPEES